MHNDWSIRRLFGERNSEMKVKNKDIFIEVVKKSDNIPKSIINEIDKTRSINEKFFDESYLQFLDDQIQLAPLSKSAHLLLMHYFVSKYFYKGPFTFWTGLFERYKYDNG